MQSKKNINIFINSLNRNQLINSLKYLHLLHNKFKLNIYLNQFSKNEIKKINISYFNEIIISDKHFLNFLISKNLKIFISNDLGLKNKTAIFFNPSRTVIIDDGTASIYRGNFFYFYLCSFSKFIFNRKIKFFSSYPRLFSNQCGFFSRVGLSLGNDDLNYSSVFQDTLFFISSNSTVDGLEESIEHKFYRRLHQYASYYNLRLIILIHPKETIKPYHMEFTAMLAHPNFELWYDENLFLNCSFATLYSSSIVHVSRSIKRIFITNLFDVKIQGTFLAKLFFLKPLDLDKTYSFYKSIDIKKLDYQDLVLNKYSLLPII